MACRLSGRGERGGHGGRATGVWRARPRACMAPSSAAMAVAAATYRGGGRPGCKKSPATKATEKAADKAALAAFLLNKYGPGGSSKLAAAEAATSTDEQVVREGQ